ncbi:nuclear transport factor 2 family protein [candidate division KSB1 bacterium]|nr:nuclear transport factor 2 family protein [candidate division KSB1 bacterium]
MKLRLIAILIGLSSLQVFSQTPRTAPIAYQRDGVSPESLVQALYEAISGKAGSERDWDRVSNLWLPNAHIIFSSGDYHGKTAFRDFTIDEFIESVRDYYKKWSFYQREIAGKTHMFGHSAQVWSTFETRSESPSGKVLLRGINNFQMVKNNGRWWIVSMVYDFESEKNTIPREYLKISNR